ncbi:hypothetical protein [Okeania sp. SIO3I5]|nr:hypothetical protein [Okeania sp. SIO3I5]
MWGVWGVSEVLEVWGVSEVSEVWGEVVYFTHILNLDAVLLFSKF